MNWQKILSLLLISLLLAGFGYIYYRKAGQLARLRQRELNYRHKVEALETRIAALLREIEFLESPAGLEKLGREQLGLVGKDEVIYIIEPTPPPGKKGEIP
jgi:cell division protein FtsB